MDDLPHLKTPFIAQIESSDKGGADAMILMLVIPTKGALIQLSMQYQCHPLGYRISEKGTLEYNKTMLNKLNQLDARLKQKSAEQTKNKHLKISKKRKSHN